jgi:hypothetical protein
MEECLFVPGNTLQSFYHKTMHLFLNSFAYVNDFSNIYLLKGVSEVIKR